MSKRITIFVAVLLIFSALFLFAEGKQETPAASAAEESGELTEWPLDSLTIVVPYNPGGTNDRQSRLIAPYLSEELGGIPVKVENRPGGSTTVAYNMHKKSQPADGSFILSCNFNSFSTAVLRDHYPYDAFVNFGILSVGHPSVLVNPQHSDAETFKELLELMENNPDQISQPSGQGWGMVVDLILRRAGLEPRIIPVTGGGSEKRVMLMAGDVDFYISDYETNSGIFTEEELGVLAILNDDNPYSEFDTANEVMAEMGYDARFPDMASYRHFQVKSEFKEQYPERFDFLAKAIKAAAMNPEFQAKAKDQNFNFVPELPETAEAKLVRIFEGIEEYEEAF